MEILKYCLLAFCHFFYWYMAAYFMSLIIGGKLPRRYFFNTLIRFAVGTAALKCTALGRRRKFRGIAGQQPGFMIRIRYKHSPQ